MKKFMNFNNKKNRLVISKGLYDTDNFFPEYNTMDNIIHLINKNDLISLKQASLLLRAEIIKRQATEVI